MSIVNRRNAVIGWGVWKLGKRIVVRRPAHRDRVKTSFLAATFAGLAGALTVWHKRRGGESS